ncbi:dephospho-CoA kinase [Actinokineospora alba]|uniref:Dephospho-CoA kinase n=1 Tax=Actinokineospora alba TaxID=504798 RepID=A0A1H0NRR4_9PSEU|nr:dephospho-CoA kinase [Actinokineospora alba]TDP68814.1 dephospho-CoA kinase [Actinokineospora alba]SDH87193.1 dephospho-CoA kinase [Actinokineospora alba]SDO95135.1 dephospho-CoA kinase [Actinokineospora alba]
MLYVGLSGGIGSGKSTVAGRLAEHGAYVVDSDKVAREVVEPGTEGLAELVAAFGDGILAEDGSLDRAALASIAFTDDESRQRLNAIMHPRVGARTAELIAEAPADAVVVQDIPLLVEIGVAPVYHLVVIVDAPVEVRVHRLVHSRGLQEADARARIAAQATEEARRAVADVWLDNSGPADQVLAAVDELWADRLVRYEANVRLHRHTPRGAPRLVEPDPTWPAQAQRVISRLRLAAGEKALRIDHIGSTSVPGLAAKDVLDVQLAVAALDDSLDEPLARAGFPLLPGFDQDTPHDGSTPWPKRTHVGADPLRWVNVHLREQGSPGWRFALLIPAWLRADDAARQEYEQLKRDLADKFDSIPEYGEAKDAWFVQAHVRAEKWAAETGWTP